MVVLSTLAKLILVKNEKEGNLKEIGNLKKKGKPKEKGET
jgi:hypothetical protein